MTHPAIERLPHSVVHYSKFDPRTTVGGVETFGRRLQLVFEEVHYMTPRTRDEQMVRRQRLPVICDNQLVRDWAPDIPVIGFQHGVGAVKFAATRSFSHWCLRERQRRAAKRARTLWVSCAEWVADAFNELYGNGGSHIIYYPVDTDRFDGKLENEASRLILHDARLKHKGARLIPLLQQAYPAWQFEHLNCVPDQVADRMRTARAFVHLSYYEGNSVVCNEAMAMNLPCFLTRVGLMRDRHRPEDVCVIEPEVAFDDPEQLIASFGDFLSSLPTRSYAPRRWSLTHATMQHSRNGWSDVLQDFTRNYSWSQ